MTATLLVVPIRILGRHHAPGHGFTPLIYFGSNFQELRLPEVEQTRPFTRSDAGYDGQFYAQVAIDPTLRHGGLATALDNAEYRSRRIGLPALAHGIGLGRPAWILQAYALLNVAVWLILFGALARFVGLRSPRDALLFVAVLWSTGVLICVERALTDLPAATLGVLAMFLGANGAPATALVSASALFKETSVLGFAMLLRRRPSGRLDFKRLAISVLLVALPIGLWLLYVRLRLPTPMPIGRGNFDLPLVGLVRKVHGELRGLRMEPFSPGRLVELACMLSLCVQALYLTAKPRVESAAWRFGILFVLLFFVLGAATLAEQYAYARIVLPLTIAFNLLIHEHESRSGYATWYTLGNAGLTSMAWKYLETQ